MNVLVVDDNADAAEVLGLVLTQLGHDVRTACTGEDAIALTQQFIPAVAWLDLQMPGMSGLELALVLRKALGNGCVLIALSGAGEDRDRLASAAVGFGLHIVKPVDFSRVRQVMQDVAESAL